MYIYIHRLRVTFNLSTLSTLLPSFIYHNLLFFSLSIYVPVSPSISFHLSSILFSLSFFDYEFPLNLLRYLWFMVLLYTSTKTRIYIVYSKNILSVSLYNIFWNTSFLINVCSNLRTDLIFLVILICAGAN